MEKTIHRAATRGCADHGWLKTCHTFSFGEYYDPERIRFGALRVLNDDAIAPGEGFGMHPHEDMEIVSIPLAGVLKHGDSMGNVETLSPGEVQVMTAGKGLMHSEYNASRTEWVRFLQIWILTDSRGHTPRYEQVRLAPPHRNRPRLIVAPEGHGGEHVGWIHQDAWLYTLELDGARETEYRLNTHGHGVYLFVLDGRIGVGGEELGPRDGMGIRAADQFLLQGIERSNLLLIEVPMR